MHCSDCRYWFSAQSQCRRYAPQPGNGGGTATSAAAHWPTVSAEDWCGEFQPAVVSPSDAAPRRAPSAA